MARPRGDHHGHSGAGRIARTGSQRGARLALRGGLPHRCHTRQRNIFEHRSTAPAGPCAGPLRVLCRVRCRYRRTAAGRCAMDVDHHRRCRTARRRQDASRLQCRGAAAGTGTAGSFLTGRPQPARSCAIRCSHPAHCPLRGIAAPHAIERNLPRPSQAPSAHACIPHYTHARG